MKRWVLTTVDIIFEERIKNDEDTDWVSFTFMSVYP